VGLWLTGCDALFGTATDDSKNSFLAAAQARKEAYDFRGAVGLLEKALEANPRLSRAHWELGLLHYQNTHDYAAAVYHLQKLLALDPKWKQADDALRIISDSKVELAKQAPFGPETPQGQKLFSGMATRIHALTAETEALRRQVEQSQATIQQLSFENQQLRELVRRGAATAPEVPATPGTSGATAAAGPVRAGSEAPADTGQFAAAGNGSLADTAQRPGAAQAKRGTAAAQSLVPPTVATHTVRKGDTAHAIARRYGITLRDLVRLNPGLDPARIKAGDVLRVRAS
jgi:LysM repeat protein